MWGSQLNQIMNQGKNQRMSERASLKRIIKSQHDKTNHKE